MAEDPIGVINLGKRELDPDDEARYRARIAEAKKGVPLSSLKKNEPLSGVARPQMPVFKRGTDTQQVVSAPAAQDGVSPRPPGSPVVKPETVQKIQEAVEAGQRMEQDAASKKEAEEKVLKDDAKMAEILESLDFADQGRQVERILDNTKRRKEIEARCVPMKVEDLIMEDEVTQRVPILPGKFEPLFRSITPVESLYIKTRMAKETVQTDQYLAEKYQLLFLTCSLVDINGAPLPSHVKRTSHGLEVDENGFDEKLRHIVNKSGYVIADLGVNCLWFDIRVRRLLNPEDVKNG